IYFKNKYYIFASMQLKVWVSEDLVNWQSHLLPKDLPLYDYAPDVCVVGDYVYFSASRREEKCDYYRTKDIIHGPYEVISGTFPFWDPHMFLDDDGRLFFYYGCSNDTPIYGMEIDKETLQPISEVKELIFGNPYENGYERIGDENTEFPASEEEIEMAFEGYVKRAGMSVDQLPKNIIPYIKGMFSKKPYIEGAWMTKHDGKYYFQYATPGTQYAIYGDGVYVGESPLGPFTLALNNPYSFNPSGFMTGAGHGSTLKDAEGRYWHTSTMQISQNHDFERRVGLWKAGFDEDGNLYCDQRYADWPIVKEDKAFSKPRYMLLSYNKPITASSYEEGKGAELAVDENSKTWWKANSNESGEWLILDLEEERTVHSIQINFADDEIKDQQPAGEIIGTSQARWIDDRNHKTRWKLEASCDKENWVVLQDKSEVDTDLPHDYVVLEKDATYRYIKLTILEVPMQQNPCISGLRVFGLGNGSAPSAVNYEVERSNDLDMRVQINDEAKGHLILWGESEDKLYHSYLTYKKDVRIGALVKGRNYCVRVDAFNENGITEGEVKGV
ncbi:MAG: family 43 glycosylhydrolase, partial [Solobacterium sp.]|nr:family 43 glycosylhydrolase [Solobacterium sp.]